MFLGENCVLFVFFFLGKIKGIYVFVEDVRGKNILESFGKIYILKVFDYLELKMGF